MVTTNRNYIVLESTTYVPYDPTMTPILFVDPKVLRSLINLLLKLEVRGLETIDKLLAKRRWCVHASRELVIVLEDRDCGLG